jgi:hypothetical protein
VTVVVIVGVWLIASLAVGLVLGKMISFSESTEIDRGKCEVPRPQTQQGPAAGVTGGVVMSGDRRRRGAHTVQPPS